VPSCKTLPTYNCSFVAVCPAARASAGILVPLVLVHARFVPTRAWNRREGSVSHVGTLVMSTVHLRRRHVLRRFALARRLWNSPTQKATCLHTGVTCHCNVIHGLSPSEQKDLHCPHREPQPVLLDCQCYSHFSAFILGDSGIRCWNWKTTDCLNLM
jgi:hypothetical protein